MYTVKEPESLMELIAYCDPCETVGLENLVNDTMNHYASSGEFKKSVVMVVSSPYGEHDVYNEDEIKTLLEQFKQAISDVENALAANQ